MAERDDRSTRLRQVIGSTGDLVRRLGHALDIAQQALHRLAAKGYTDSRDPNYNLRPEKVISETAFLLLGASIAGDHKDLRDKIRGVAEILLPYARSERMVLGLCLEPALALDYAQAHICLTRLGYPDAAFDAVLCRSLEALARNGRERPPHRALEQEWLLGGWEHGHTPSGREDSLAARHSALGRPMDLLSGSHDNVYAFTHALIYVTDFNLRPGPSHRRLPRPLSEILGEAEAALGRCLEEEDYDLGGEVLLAWPLAAKRWTAASAFGFRVLAAVEDQAGFLPSPGTRLQRLNELSGDERTEYLLATAYHTAYVMGLACAAALKLGKTPRIAAVKRVTGSAEAILQFIDNSGTRPHWRQEFERLSPSERDALASLLFAIALRRQVTRRDFAALRELLALGARLDLVDCPAASQAAQLLERLAAAAPLLLKAPRPF